MNEATTIAVNISGPNTSSSEQNGPPSSWTIYDDALEGLAYVNYVLLPTMLVLGIGGHPHNCRHDVAQVSTTHFPNLLDFPRVVRCNFALNSAI